MKLITMKNIGKIRRFLMMPFSCKWNAWVIKEIEKITIDKFGDGKTIESLAKDYGIPDSVMAIQLLEISKEAIINQLRKIYET